VMVIVPACETPMVSHVRVTLLPIHSFDHSFVFKVLGPTMTIGPVV